MTYILSSGGVPVKTKDVKRVSNKNLEIKNPTLEKAKKILQKLKELQ